MLEEVTAKGLYESAAKAGELASEYFVLLTEWSQAQNDAIVAHSEWHTLPEHTQHVMAIDFCLKDRPELAKRVDELAMELEKLKSITMMVTAAGWAASYERDSRLTRMVMQES